MLLALVLLLSIAAASRVAPEPRPHTRNGWTRLAAPVPADERITFHVALKRRFEHVTSELRWPAWRGVGETSDAWLQAVRSF